MPKIAASDQQQYMFPLGIAYVSSAMKAAGYHVETLNLNYKSKSLAEIFKEHLQGIDVFMTGGLSGQFRTIKNMIDTAKAINPEIKIVVGGGLITADPIPAMEALENADFGVIGEGEVADCELAYALEGRNNLKNVSGIVFRTDTGWNCTPPAQQISDLDILPWPDYEGFEYGEMLNRVPSDNNLVPEISLSRMGAMIFSRGCPYLCTFCFHSSGNRYRQKSMDAFFAEFDYLVKTYSLDSFNLIDEMFMKNEQFVIEFCERVKPYHLHWVAQGRVDNITDRMVTAMRDAGCYMLQFGLESGNDTILKSMRKNITVAQINQALDVCYRCGVHAVGNLIFGDVSETIETAKDSLRWFQKHRRFDINLIWILVYPGTDLYHIAIKRGLIKNRAEYLRKCDWSLNLSKMTDDECKQISELMISIQNGERNILSNPSISKGKLGKIDVTGNCPYCRARSTYKDIDIIRPKNASVCPSCGESLDLCGYDYLNIRQGSFLKKLSSRKVVLWPAIHNLERILGDLNIAEHLIIELYSR